MKKIFRLIAALAATTVAFSCLEEANPEIENVTNGSTEKVGTHYEGPMTTLEFSVDTDLKTSYNKEDGHQWSEGDQIKIIWGPEDDAFVVAEVINGTVSAEVGDVDTYYAVYPETTKHSWNEVTDGEGNTSLKFSFAIPDVQDGTFKQANIMAAKTGAGEKFFAFARRPKASPPMYTASAPKRRAAIKRSSSPAGANTSGMSFDVSIVIPHIE